MERFKPSLEVFDVLAVFLWEQLPSVLPTLLHARREGEAALGSPTRSPWRSPVSPTGTGTGTGTPTARGLFRSP